MIITSQTNVARLAAVAAVSVVAFFMSAMPSQAAEFAVGDRVVTSQQVNVRGTTGVSGTLNGEQTAGAYGIIIAGPVLEDGYTWYRVDYDLGVDGWSVSDYFTAVTTLPRVTTQVTTSASTQATLQALLAQLAILQERLRQMQAQ